MTAAPYDMLAKMPTLEVDVPEDIASEVERYLSVDGDELAAEASVYLAAVDVYRDLVPGRYLTGPDGRPTVKPAGPSWRSEDDELGRV